MPQGLKINRKDIKVGTYLQCPERQDAVRLVVKTKKHVLHTIWLSLRSDGLHVYHGKDVHEFSVFENSNWYIKT